MNDRISSNSKNIQNILTTWCIIFLFGLIVIKSEYGYVESNFPVKALFSDLFVFHVHVLSIVIKKKKQSEERTEFLSLGLLFKFNFIKGCNKHWLLSTSDSFLSNLIHDKIGSDHN